MCGKKALTEPLFVGCREEWHDWLQNNHQSEEEVWLIYLKKHTGRVNLTVDDAVEEAICFGWIDSLVRSIDQDSYMQKYTPRKKNSVWSERNKKRALNLLDRGLMTEAGRKTIEEAKANGKWDAAYSGRKEVIMPEDLLEALLQNTLAWDNFNNFAPGYRNTYIRWVNDAKREDTRKKRIQRVVARSAEKLKPGIDL